MVDWKSSESLQHQAFAFNGLMHSLAGIYFYECIISIKFDWEHLNGRRQFRWPMIFYFANRYVLLFTMCGILTALNVRTKVNCQALYTFNQIAGGASIGLASINLAIRTVAIWAHNRWIIGGLILIICGHWSLILQGGQLTAIWVDDVGCVITETKTKPLSAMFIYSMCFDLLILLMNTWKLWGLSVASTATKGVRRSRLSQILFKDGLIFFFIAFFGNLVATVFMLLDLSQIMSVIFDVPSAIFGTIVACRAVRRLSDYSMRVQVYGSTHVDGPTHPQNLSSIQFADDLIVSSHAAVESKPQSDLHFNNTQRSSVV